MWAGDEQLAQQWKTLGFRKSRFRLLVLDFERDKANVKQRFFEAFPLTEHLLDDADVIERLRALVNDAQDVRLCLVRALTRAHDDRKHGGLALADAETAFWTVSEEPFFDWLASVVATDEWTEEAEQRTEAARKQMASALRRTALRIFDAHVEISEFEPAIQARVAKARRSLVRALYPKDKVVTSTSDTREVPP